MTEEEYYTPTIEEFHVGFEYEINSIYLVTLKPNSPEKKVLILTEEIEKFYDIGNPELAPYHELHWNKMTVDVTTNLMNIERRIKQGRIRVKKQKSIDTIQYNKVTKEMILEVLNDVFKKREIRI